MLSKRSVITFGAVTLLIATQTPRPAEANPAIAAPAVCVTGVGCVLLGTVVIGGAIYYVWQNQRTGRRYQVPAGASAIVDQDNPRGWWPGERVPVATRDDCVRIARRYRKRLIRIESSAGMLRYICVFAPAENPLEDW